MSMRGFSGNWQGCVDGRAEALNGSARIVRRSLFGLKSKEKADARGILRYWVEVRSTILGAFS